MSIVLEDAPHNISLAARDLIKPAIRLLGQLPSGSDPSNEEYEDGVDALNNMLDGWSVQRNAMFARTEDALSLVSGTRSYTIGTNGAFNTTRPIKCEQAFIRDNDIDYPVDCSMTQQEHNDIGDKTVSARPTRLFYNADVDLATIYFNRVPDQAYSFYLYSWKPFSYVTDKDTVVSLPPGYRRAIIYNLAVALAPEYKMQASADIAAIAYDALKNIKRVNAEAVYTKNCVTIGSGRVSSSKSAFNSGFITE